MLNKSQKLQKLVVMLFLRKKITQKKFSKRISFPKTIKKVLVCSLRSYPVQHVSDLYTCIHIRHTSTYVGAIVLSNRGLASWLQYVINTINQTKIFLLIK